MAERIDFLSKIRLSRKLEIDELKATRPLTQLMKHLPDQKAFQFRAAMNAPGIRVIAELKKASPSKGILRADFDVRKLAGQYAEGGAAALSVLTEPIYFLGKSEYLAMAKEASALPVLCKDFIVDSYQIYHARVMRADVILLICRMLTDEQLLQWIQLAEQLEMDALVETHTLGECERALQAGAQYIGVNARDLESFRVDLEITRTLRQAINPPATAVAESGIQSRADIDSLQKIGYRHFLIGEALVTNADPVSLLKEMTRR